MILQTEHNVNINQRVEDGKTLFFANEFIAIEEAKKLRTYHYQVFDSKMKHVGYGVPR